MSTLSDIYLNPPSSPDSELICHVCYALQQLSHYALQQLSHGASFSKKDHELAVRRYLDDVLSRAQSTKGTCLEHSGEMTAAYFRREQWLNYDEPEEGPG